MATRLATLLALTLWTAPLGAQAQTPTTGVWVYCKQARLDSRFFALSLGGDGRARMAWRLNGDDQDTTYAGRVRVDTDTDAVVAEFASADAGRIVFLGGGWRRGDRAGALFGSFLVQNRVGDRWATVNGFPTTLVPLEHSHCARQRIERVLSDS